MSFNSNSTYPQQIDGYEPDVDYPAYDAVPRDLSFSCSNRLPGYYADIETRCQVWHWCLHSGTMFDFLCPNGTVFNQVRKGWHSYVFELRQWNCLFKWLQFRWNNMLGKYLPSRHVKVTPTNHSAKCHYKQSGCNRESGWENAIIFSKSPRQ